MVIIRLLVVVLGVRTLVHCGVSHTHAVVVVIGAQGAEGAVGDTARGWHVTRSTRAYLLRSCTRTHAHTSSSTTTEEEEEGEVVVVVQQCHHQRRP